MSKAVSAVVCAVLLSVVCSGAYGKPRGDQWTLGIGAFWAELDSELDARFVGSNKIRHVDLEDDLNLKESTVSPFIEVSYRLDERHAFSLNYINLNRSGTNSGITKPFDFTFDGVDYTVTADATLRTKLDIDIFQLVYGYTFYPSDNTMLALTAGMHVMRFGLAFSGDIALINEDESGDRVTIPIAENEVLDGKATAPLPDFGLFATYDFGDGWIALANTQYFAISLDDFSGSLIDARLEFSKQITDRLAVGVAYQYYNANVDSFGLLADLSVNFNYYGPELSMRYFF
ncbi:hypothetical protein [Paraferrimonas haliotis]|uniref:DUF481 domain-containing protein n=1 Tax=Paraferrimonas haliotis TaxID=2013866 RepID=A0AA37TRZ0_9GAMM|nr:hypothetical protein [Paraferrimonas haliotis]GLS84240.1 DUF481 domain-containing protein [Paraferrimonas haliotis]